MKGLDEMNNLTAISIIDHDWNYICFMASNQKAYQIQAELGSTIYMDIAEEFYPDITDKLLNYPADLKEQISEIDMLAFANQHKKTWEHISELATSGIIEIANNFFAAN